MKNSKCPNCGMEAKKKKSGLKETVLCTLAKLIVLSDPAPTPFVKKTKNVYRCTNCGYEWTE